MHLTWFTPLLTTTISESGNAIASVRLSDRLFSLQFLKRVTFEIDRLYAFVSGIEVKVKTRGVKHCRSCPKCGQF